MKRIFTCYFVAGTTHHRPLMGYYVPLVSNPKTAGKGGYEIFSATPPLLPPPPSIVYPPLKHMNLSKRYAPPLREGIEEATFSAIDRLLDLSLRVDRDIVMLITDHPIDLIKDGGYELVKIKEKIDKIKKKGGTVVFRTNSLGSGSYIDTAHSFFLKGSLLNLKNNYCN